MIDSDEITDYNPLPGGNNDVIIDSRIKVLLIAFRRALLLMVAAIEVFLEIPRSKPPTHR